MSPSWPPGGIDIVFVWEKDEMSRLKHLEKGSKFISFPFPEDYRGIRAPALLDYLVYIKGDKDEEGKIICTRIDKKGKLWEQRYLPNKPVIIVTQTAEPIAEPKK